MLDMPLLATLNHLLRQHRWALDLLVGHAGKQIVVKGGLLPWRFTIQDNGELGSARDDVPAALTVQLTPAALTALALRRAPGNQDWQFDGDAGLAQDLRQIAENVRWDAEEDLSKVFGDTAAQKLVAGARAFAGWQEQAMQTVARQWTEYLTQEKPVVASAGKVREFTDQVDQLRDDVDRLEARIAQLEGRRAPLTP